jgi:hypothetical protein
MFYEIINEFIGLFSKPLQNPFKQGSELLSCKMNTQHPSESRLPPVILKLCLEAAQIEAYFLQAVSGEQRLILN